MPKDKKKIIYLVTQSEWGGAQKYIYDLATHLSKDEFDILVAAGEDDKELFNRLQKKQIRTQQLKHIVRAIRPIKEILAFFELLKLFKKEKPNIIHLNSSKISILGSFTGWMTKKVLGLRSLIIIYTVHGWVFNEPLPFWKKKLYYVLEKLTASLKDKIICVSEYDRQIALNKKIAKPSKLITIPNGTDLKPEDFLDKHLARQELQKILNTEFRISNFEFLISNFAIGTIANLYPTKGLSYLIKAASCLIKDNPDLIFIIIGEGDERKKLESLIKQHNLTDNFSLLGNVKAAYKYLKAFDIFVLPSVKEGWPYTILEAQKAGLPIIATKVGGVPEIITDNENGLLVPPADPAGLQKAIQKLLTDDELTTKLQQNSIISSNKFSLKRTLAKTLKLYQ